MQWRDWNDDSFAEARRRGCPVLLLITASWCRFCRALEEKVLADPRVRELIGGRFVAIRVDKDRRPELDGRYSRGGWPTLAWLDHSGEPIATDAYLEAPQLLRRLGEIADGFAGDAQTTRERLAEAERGGAAPTGEEGEVPAPPFPSPEMLDGIARTVLETADPVYGGWGQQHKYPHPEAIDFAMVRWSQTGEEEMRGLVLRTLRHMQKGQIHDRVEGGFYRYATLPDWSGPHHEKMLDSNAARLVAYLEAYQAFGDQSFRGTAEGILRWMQRTLLDPETGAFRGSQDADPVYAHMPTLEARREHGAPACDPTIFAHWNAQAVSALIKASTILHEPAWLERALRTLDFLLENLFDRRQGMFHYWDGTYRLPGMLTDQAYTLRALVDAAQHAGGSRYLPQARALAELTIELLRSEDGGFYDMRFDPAASGGLRRRNRSLLENAVLAEALLRLSHLERDPDLEDAARETLASFADDYKRYGHFVAGFARAADLLLNPPVQVTVVGQTEGKDTAALVRAAQTPYLASRIVQVVDPAIDAELLERCQLPTAPTGSRGARPPSARAYVQRSRESYAETSDPARLPALMTRVERGA